MRYRVQAVYLDDQQSGWLVTQITFTDCTVCSFIGGGRHNTVSANRFVRCGTVQYLNDQGLSDPSLNGTPASFDSCPAGPTYWSNPPRVRHVHTPNWKHLGHLTENFLLLFFFFCFRVHA